MTKLGSFKGVVLFAIMLGTAGCAHEAPDQLADARRAYREAAAGPATQFAPGELHYAKEALDAAGRAYDDQPGSDTAQDLAYIAQRRAQTAQAVASTRMARDQKERADQAFLSAQNQATDQTRAELEQARQALEETRRQQAIEQERMSTREQLQQTNEQLMRERQARLEAEQQAAAAMAQLKRAGQVSEEQRGTVITVPGSVLFASAQWALLPTAISKLDEVARVLSSMSDRNIIVEGYADSSGPEDYNLELSQRRAETVRDYLVTHGVRPENIRAIGYGEARPIASNTTAEGRALNRRVEVVIERERAASK